MIPTLAGALAVQLCASRGAIELSSKVMRMMIFFMMSLSASNYFTNPFPCFDVERVLIFYLVLSEGLSRAVSGRSVAVQELSGLRFSVCSPVGNPMRPLFSVHLFCRLAVSRPVPSVPPCLFVLLVRSVVSSAGSPLSAAVAGPVRSCPVGSAVVAGPDLGHFVVAVGLVSGLAGSALVLVRHRLLAVTFWRT